jgi:hypothetical protein
MQDSKAGNRSDERSLISTSVRQLRRRIQVETHMHIPGGEPGADSRAIVGRASHVLPRLTALTRGESEEMTPIRVGGEKLSEIAKPKVLPPACDSRWFAAYTSPRHEKRVEQYLSVRQIEHYLPLYHPRRKWADGSTVTLDLPLFPSYIFVRIEHSERVRVLEVPGVVTFVGGTGCQPASLPEVEIEALRAGLRLRRAGTAPFADRGPASPHSDRAPWPEWRALSCGKRAACASFSR